MKPVAIERDPHGLRIKTLCPTFIRTPLREQTLAAPARRAWIGDKIKQGRVGEVEGMMGAALYLCSDTAGIVTGTPLLVDGGWTAD